jgi:lysophospholipid acyltransferase (LPLAT)-like uncharacterized protein
MRYCNRKASPPIQCAIAEHAGVPDNAGVPNEPGGPLRNTIYEQRTRSGRQLTAARLWLYRLIVPIGRVLIRLVWRASRVVSIAGTEHISDSLARSPSFIPVYWHQHQLFCIKHLLSLRPLGVKLGFLISPSVDGELGAMLVRSLGAEVIRGSSTHTGARALRDYYQALVRDNVSPVITPDGPRGPRFKFKPGALLLAQMSGRPILPMSYAASRAWLIKWDRFVIPVPFSRVALAIGPPCYVPRVTDAAMLERLQGQMEQELRRLYVVARDALAHPR